MALSLNRALVVLILVGTLVACIKSPAERAYSEIGMLVRPAAIVCVDHVTGKGDKMTLARFGYEKTPFDGEDLYAVSDPSDPRTNLVALTLGNGGKPSCALAMAVGGPGLQQVTYDQMQQYIVASGFTRQSINRDNAAAPRDGFTNGDISFAIEGRQVENNAAAILLQRL